MKKMLLFSLLSLGISCYPYIRVTKITNESPYKATLNQYQTTVNEKGELSLKKIAEHSIKPKSQIKEIKPEAILWMTDLEILEGKIPKIGFTCVETGLPTQRPFCYYTNLITGKRIKDLITFPHPHSYGYDIELIINKKGYPRLKLLSETKA